MPYMNGFIILALISGACISIQAVFNARLGVMLGHPLYASGVALFVGLGFAMLASLVLVRHFPNWESVHAVPWYLWLAGGMLSALAITLFFYLIPIIGIAPTITAGLSGQLIMAVIAGHFGLFGLPVKPIDYIKLVGILALFLGIFLINRE